jgi:uncharacterized protein
MKLPDVNVLLHAVNASARQHQTAKKWLSHALVQPRGVALTWTALIGYLRLSTRSGILAPPLTVEQAMAPLHRWLAAPAATVIHPGVAHAGLVGRLLLGAGTAGNLTTDAHLAAIAIEHGATLVSFDRDFERFAGLSFEHLS